MGKQHNCKDCEYFKNQENLCSYYESNTYSDTPACSKFKNEKFEEEELEEQEEIKKLSNLTETTNQDNGINVPLESKKEEIQSSADSNKENCNEAAHDGLIVKQKKLYVEDKKDDYEENLSPEAGLLTNPEPLNQKGSMPVTDKTTHGPKVRQITDTDYYKPESMFSHPFSFEGRIRRTEFGLSFILFYIGTWIIGFIVGLAMSNYIYYSPDGESVAKLVCYILLIPAYWFIFAQGAKRCHDRNNSGWYQLIPFYGLWMLFADGDAGENAYGMPPKATYNGQRVLNNGELDDGSGTIDTSSEEEEHSEQTDEKMTKNSNNSSTNIESSEIKTNNDKNTSKKDNSMLFIIIAGILTIVLIVVLCLAVSCTNANSQDDNTGVSIENTTSDDGDVGSTFNISIDDNNDFDSGFDDNEEPTLDDDDALDDEDNSEDIDDDQDDYTY